MTPNVIIRAALLEITAEVVLIGVYFNWVALPIAVVSILVIVLSSVRRTP